MSIPDVTLTIRGDLREPIARELSMLAHRLKLRIEGRPIDDEGDHEFWSAMVGRRNALREIIKQLDELDPHSVAG